MIEYIQNSKNRIKINKQRLRKMHFATHNAKKVEIMLGFRMNCVSISCELN